MVSTNKETFYVLHGDTSPSKYIAWITWRLLDDNKVKKYDSSKNNWSEYYLTAVEIYWEWCEWSEQKRMSAMDTNVNIFNATEEQWKHSFDKWYREEYLVTKDYYVPYSIKVTGSWLVEDAVCPVDAEDRAHKEECEIYNNVYLEDFDIEFEDAEETDDA